MTQSRTRVPISLPVTAVVLLILGLIANPVIQSQTTPEQLARNVILAAIPFILIFSAIILAFMSLVWFAASKLNDTIPNRIYRPIEWALIGGIALGAFGMFQPWFLIMFRLGFYMLLASTLGFILWTHIRPRGALRPEHLRSVSINEYESESAAGD